MGRGPTIAAALIAALAVLWWLLRSKDAEAEPGPVVSRYDVEALMKLPNYRPRADNKLRFASHAEFVRTLDQAFIERFPGKVARSILIAHAATGGGWHVYPKKAALYHWNLWGQTCSDELIAKGVAFTILTPKKGTGRAQAFRAFSSPREALMGGYIPNVKWYGTGGIEFLDTRETITREVCVKYATLIKKWFKAASRTPAELDDTGGDWWWIYKKFLMGKLL